MRVAVECRSPLLQKSLELFLGKHLSSPKNCDILIKDTKCADDERCFYVSSAKDADLKKPFSSSQLMISLEKRYKELKEKGLETEYTEEDEADFDILQRRIESLTQEYQANILRAVRAFYEK